MTIALSTPSYVHYIGADNLKVYPITYPTYENTTINVFVFRPYDPSMITFPDMSEDIANADITLVESTDFTFQNISKANTSLTLLDASAVPPGWSGPIPARQEWLTAGGFLKAGWLLVIHFTENAIQPATLANNALLAVTTNRSIDRLAMHIKALYHLMSLAVKYSERTVLIGQPIAPLSGDQIQLMILQLQQQLNSIQSSMGNLNGDEGDFLEFTAAGNLGVQSGIFSGQSATLGRFVTTTGLHDAIYQLFNWVTNPPQVAVQSTPSHAGNKEKGIPFTVTNLRLVLTRGSEADLASAMLSISGAGLAGATGAGDFPYSFSKPGTMTGASQNIDVPQALTFSDNITVTGQVTAENAESGSAAINYNFVYPTYYGRGSKPVSDVDLKLLGKYLLSGKNSSMPCTVGSNFYCLAYPAAFGDLTSIVQSLFPTIPTIGNWTKRTTTLVMADGASVLYNVYETNVESSTSTGNWQFS